MSDESSNVANLLDLSRQIHRLWFSNDVPFRRIVGRRFDVILSTEQTSTTIRSVVSDDDVDIQNVGGSSDRRFGFETAAQQRSEKDKKFQFIY